MRWSIPTTIPELAENLALCLERPFVETAKVEGHASTYLSNARSSKCVKVRWPDARDRGVDRDPDS
jgi:hypothetical protein